eukprot:10197-Rhodomonas_salina.2
MLTSNQDETAEELRRSRARESTVDGLASSEKALMMQVSSLKLRLKEAEANVKAKQQHIEHLQASFASLFHPFDTRCPVLTERVLLLGHGRRCGECDRGAGAAGWRGNGRSGETEGGSISSRPTPRFATRGADIASASCRLWGRWGG